MKFLKIDKSFPDNLYKIPFYKDVDTFEIAISLFEVCNLKCDFCFESHNISDINFNYIHTIPYIVYNKFLIESKKYTKINSINFKLWGGELFFDALNDSFFIEYKKFVDTIKNLFKKYNNNINFNFSWLSNGVFSKYSRVLDLLKYTNGKISFSYDPIGRFSNNEQKYKMIENFNRFKKLNLLNCISITLTKQSINAYINNKSDIELFRGCFFDINFYTANPGWEKLIVSDDDLFLFLKWAIDNNWTDIGIVQACIDSAYNNKVPHYCDCKSNLQFSKNICTIDCALRASVLDKKYFYGEYSNIANENICNEIKVSLGMKKRGCIYCEYFNVCQKPCWITTIFSGYKPTECPYKKIYKYIKNEKY